MHLNAKMRRKKCIEAVRMWAVTWCMNRIDNFYRMNRNCPMSEVCCCVEFSWATSEPDVNM